MTVDAWWDDVTTAALLGTTRRPPPELSDALGVRPRSEAQPEDQAAALLNAAALGGLLRRAGLTPTTTGLPEQAAADALPEAPAEAVQLLELLLHQSPAGRELRVPLVRAWLVSAAETSVRAPHRLLPELLDMANADVRLRDGLADVVGARGAWLAAHNESWSWLLVTTEPEPTDDDWSRMTGAARADLVTALRLRDPGRARELVESTWSTDGATHRKALVECLHIALSPDDEPFLEAALNDRSKGVRDAALAALDHLSGSRRSARMGARLRPLISSSQRLLGRAVTIERPPDADAAAIRDGLVRPGGGASGHNLAALAATAPLSTWTDATGLSPGEVYALVKDEDALRGIRRAVQLQRDAVWAAMLVEDHRLVAMLPYVDPAARTRLAPRLIAKVKTPAEAIALLQSLPGPWDPATSEAVVRMVVETGEHVLRLHSTTLAERLHPDAAARLRQVAGSDRGDRTAASQVLQFLTLRHAIREAFA